VAGADDGEAARRRLRPPGRIRRRADFLAANRGARIVAESFILLVRPAGQPAPRAGFTVSRKLGGAVARNRARRRLREVARLVLAAHAVPGADHVFIARPRAGEQSFGALLQDAERALARARARLAARAPAKATAAERGEGG